MNRDDRWRLLREESLSARRSAAGHATLALFAMAAAYLLFISWLDPALPWPVSFASKEPWLLALLNIVPVVLLNLLLLIITRRVALASWLTMLVIATLYAINKLKLQELATPLLPDDFHFLKALGVNYSFFSHYLAGAKMQLLIAVLVLAVTLLLSREKVVPSLRGLRRALAGIAVVAITFSLVQGSAPWTKIYDAGRLQFEPWAPFDSAARTGMITNMLLFHWELRSDGMERPDLVGAAQLIRDVQPESNRAFVAPAAEGFPDIIIVQSESLFDPSRLEGIEHSPLAHLRATAARSWAGDLRVPTFAGGTIRTEFEVLTGMPLAAFPQVRYPYLQFTRRDLPGLARVLTENGYRTLAIHPNGGAFWNRNHAFRALGFERFIDVDGFADAERHGWYISDAALIDRIIAELADDGAPQLIMGISIQNHGPYTPHGTTATPSAAHGLPQALNESQRETLDIYYSLLKATDEQLGRLIAHVEARRRRTLVLFYSDHLPPLNAIYERVPFRDARIAREQPVPWLLFDNRSNDPAARNVSAWLLPALVLERAGIPGGRYFDLLRDVANNPQQAEEMHALARLHYWTGLDAALDAPAESSVRID